MYINLVVTRRRRVLLLAVLLLAVAALLAQAFIPGGVLGVVSRQQRLVPIYFVDTPEKKIAISFDASWGAEFTPTILDILRENNIKTTFFLTGFWIEKYPDLVKKIDGEGHELGNHTATHPHLNTLNKEAIKIELERVHGALHQLTGKEPFLFRPPFGEYSNNVIEAAAELDYLTIQWSVDSLDWKDLGKDTIVKRVTDRLHPGAIVLFHNNGRYTADALPEILAFAKEKGYTVVPISELLYKDNYYIDNSNGAQKKKGN
jgi:peptidoglycan-N-acetylglucosamine deacetylase